jgi:DNA helicase-2/ATP-dependent DNA helicase PcrA
MRAMQSRPVTAEEAVICAGEERLFAEVREALTAVEEKRGRGNRRAALMSLREDYAEAGEEDRLAVLEQMAQEAARADALAPRKLPDVAAPYFGHMRVRTGGRARDVLLGERPYVDAARGVTIVAFRQAPIAEVFFTCDPGDDYEIEVDGRTIEGVLERRHLVVFEKGEVAAISVEGGTLQRDQGAWRFAAEGMVPSLPTGEPGSCVIRGGPRLAGLLDAHQQALLDRDAGQPLLVLGSAGCGKTTVALHRVAALAQRHPDRFGPSRALVIVPEPGLRRFSELLLADLGFEGVAVRTFDDWIRVEARRVFPWLPARESPEAPFAVSRFKRHPAMLAAIDRLIDDLARSIGERIDHRLQARGEVAAALAARTEPILLHRLESAERALVEAALEARRSAIAEAFHEERKKLARVRDDHLRLVGDRALLAHAAQASSGDLSPRLIEEVATHTNRQLDKPSEVRFAHVKASRRKTLDGRSLDDGTPEAVAGTVDVEDYALLFEILYRKTGTTGTRAGSLATHAHLVLDEAQELAPVELHVLGRAVDPDGGSITVAGDAAQRIDKTGHFATWEAAMAALGTRAAPTYLETSYRCPRPIVELAHAILGTDAPEAMPRAAREGAPVVRTRLPTEGHAAAALVHALRELVAREPEASVAVLAHDASAAQRIHAVLARALPARLVLDGEFSFGPGIEVTEVTQIKGLEFDYVIVPDADAKSYPDTPEHRRRLHVAATRASKRLWIMSPGVPSPILPAPDSPRPERASADLHGQGYGAANSCASALTPGDPA